MGLLLNQVYCFQLAAGGESFSSPAFYQSVSIRMSSGEEDDPFCGIREAITTSPIILSVEEGQEEFSGLVERLTINNELQKLLSDEKMRSETHKGHYQQLKTQFIKILHESKSYAVELAKLKDDNRNLEQVLMSSKEENHRLKRDYEAKIEKLTNQIPTEGQFLALEQRVKTSNDNVWMSRITETIDDLEASKITVQQLMKENLCLRHIHTHAVEDHEREMEELSLNFQGKIKHLERVVNNLEESHRPAIAALEGNIIKQGLENSKLQEQIKFLEKSLEESERERKESLDKISLLSRTYADENRVSNAQLSKLRAEKISLEKTLSSTEEEMKKYKAEGLALRQLLDNSQTASNDVEDKIRESMHSIKEETERKKLEFAKEKTALVCEKDFIGKQFEDLKMRYENLSSAKCMLEQEAESLRHSLDIQKAEDKTQRAEKIALLEVKNSELQMKLKSLDQINSSLKMEKESTDSELLRRLEERELMITDISSLSKDIIFFQSELDRLVAKENDLAEQLIALEEENNKLRRDVFSHEDQSNKCHNYSKLIKKLRTRLEESNERLEAFKRIHDGADEEVPLNIPSSQTSPSHTSSSIRKTAEDETYQRLKLKYQDLKARHKKFSKLLKSSTPLEQL